MNYAYRLLLERVARFHERHEAGRRQEFNVFSVLRSEHDEVDLHSRFLAALLDYRQWPGESRENLADFLDRLKIKGLDHDRACVDREWRNIDIVVRDRVSMRAVIIENKILASDQPEQLRRYVAQMSDYEILRILYLTLDGRPASEDSAGNIEYECISYKSDMMPWLKGCQMRAHDEPPLRESIAQYQRLIAKLTGTHFSEAYMNDLTKLCLKGDNLVLVHDLGEAMIEAKISLLRKLWREIKRSLREEIPDLPDVSSDISKERIEKFVKLKTNYRGHGLYYDLGNHAQLCVEVADRIYFGVYCEKKSSREKYLNLAKYLDGWKSEESWPVYKWHPTDLNLKKTSRDQLALLASQEGRRNYVAEVVSGVRTLWENIK